MVRSQVRWSRQPWCCCGRCRHRQLQAPQPRAASCVGGPDPHPCRGSLAAASVAEIERFNILGATMLAMRRAVARLRVRPGLVLIDGNRAPALGLPCRCVVGGDAIVPEIGAASIVAKVVRDALMARLAQRHPGYGWEHNAGYPTPEHLAALARLGLNLHHRRQFAPCAQLVSAAARGRRCLSCSAAEHRRPERIAGEETLGTVAWRRISSRKAQPGQDGRLAARPS